MGIFCPLGSKFPSQGGLGVHFVGRIGEGGALLLRHNDHASVNASNALWVGVMPGSITADLPDATAEHSENEKRRKRDDEDVYNSDASNNLLRKVCRSVRHSGWSWWILVRHRFYLPGDRE